MPQPTPLPNRSKRRGRRTSRNALAVYATGGAVFLGTAGFLSANVATGHDPSLNARTAVSTAAAAKASTIASVSSTAPASASQPAVRTTTS